MPRTQRSRNAVPASIHGPRIGFLLCVLALVLIGFVMGLANKELSKKARAVCLLSLIHI